MLTDFPALAESVKHEFHDEKEARFELTWKSGAQLVAVWPPRVDNEGVEPFFYLEKRPGMPVRDTAAAKTAFPLLGIIPILTPVEHSEGLRDDAYVRTNVSSRLSSRHFRNNIRLMIEDGAYDAFCEYIENWLDGVELLPLGHHYDDGMILDLFYTEAGSRVPKELVWSGDGIQIWLQILYHVYRTRDRETLILDEPEVYLHPDLQRSLVRLLEDTGRQTIVATHSAEIVAEADSRLVTIVDKTERRARRADEPSSLELLSNTLGTAFNLRLTRALRSKVVFFVEGKDMAVLERFAKTLDMSALATQRGVTIIPLEGYSKWVQVRPFAWLCKSLLPEAIKIFVALDHDFRPEEITDKVENEFAAEGITAHVWRRKELESYLLTPTVIARLSGADSTLITEILDEISAGMESDVSGQRLAAWLDLERPTGKHVSTSYPIFKEKFDLMWGDPLLRLYSCRAKRVIAALNNQLREGGYKQVTARSLATAHLAYEISPEMVALLRRVEEAVH